MTWRIEFASSAAQDFRLIYDHLVESYVAFGESTPEARDHARRRIDGILDDAVRLTDAPLRGARHDDLLPGLRHLTVGQAVFWFTVADDQGLIRVLAVFFGSQDHHRRMLIRLLQQGIK